MGGRCDIVSAVATLLERRGGQMYVGEPVTQQAHALQCARLAEQEGATDALVVAALLHDIGHLIHGEDVADGRHEQIGHTWLAQYFGLDVVEPVRLHVDAKRYLCGADAAYAASLSLASRRSLALQGGPLAGRALRDFAERPYARDAVRLRRWDDRAKTPGRVVRGLAHYETRLRRMALHTPVIVDLT